MNACPRCHGAGLVPTSNGVQCLLCGYTEEKDDLSLYAEVMAAAPGEPVATLLKKTRKTRWEKRGIR